MAENQANPYVLVRADQYDQWRYLMLEKIVNSVRKRQLINNEVNLDDPEIHDELTVNQIEAFKKADKVLKTDIIERVNYKHCNMILGKSTAYEMWVTLEEHFKGSKYEQLENAKKKMKSLRYLGNITEWMKLFKKRAEKLKSLECKWSNREIISLVLEKFPAPFISIIVNIKTMLMDAEENEIEVDMKQVLRKLKVAGLEIESMKTKKKSVQDNPRKVINNYKKQYTKKIKEEANLVEEEEKCKHCKKSGHTSKQCMYGKIKRLKNKLKAHNIEFDSDGSESEEEIQNSNESDQETEIESENDEANMIMDAFLEDETEEINNIEAVEEERGYIYDLHDTGNIANEVDLKKKNSLKKEIAQTWFKMDSGATIHVKTSEENLFDVVECNKAVSVAKQDVVLYAKKKGKMKWYLENGKFLIVNDVYVIPNARNLLSVGRICEDFEAKMEFDGNSVTLRRFNKFLAKFNTKNTYALQIKHEPESGLTKRQKLKKRYEKLNLQNTFRYHLLFGHPSYRRLLLLLRKHFGAIPLNNSNYCYGCLKGKHPQCSFKHESNSFVEKATRPLQRFYLDAVGPFTPESRAKNKRCLILTDSFTKFRWVLFDTKKKTLGTVLYEFLLNLNKQFPHWPILEFCEIIQNVQAVHSDGGSEFINGKVQDFFKKHGIQFEQSTPGIPARNGTAERTNRTILECAKTLMYTAGWPRNFWHFAIKHAVLLNNVLPLSSGDDTIPFEKLFHRTFDYSKLEICGVSGQGRNEILLKNAKKLDAKTQNCIYLTYDVLSNDYVVLWRRNNAVGRTHQFIADTDGFLRSFQNTNDRLHRPFRDEDPVTLDELFHVDDIEAPSFTPKHYFAAIKSQHGSFWQEAYIKETSNIKKLGQCEKVKVPENVQIIPILELFSYKYDSVEKKFKFKVRVVIRGDKELNFRHKTFAPVVKSTIIRIVLFLLGALQFVAAQLDITCAFLYGKRLLPYFLEIPLGHEDREIGYCWKTIASIYGLRDSPRRWYQLLRSLLIKFGLEACPSEPCLFVMKEWKLVVIIYVDDILYFSKEEEMLLKFQNFLQKHFNLKTTNKLQKYVGHEILNDDSGMWLHCYYYIQACLRRFGLDKSAGQKNPGKKSVEMFPTTGKLLNSHQQEVFLCMLGCLNYIAGLCRPDIAFVTNFLARCSQSAFVTHLKLAKQAFQYLKHTANYGIRYNRLQNNEDLRLIGYSDADFANDNISRKSISGYIIQIGNSTVNWLSKRQPIVAQSTFEAEFIALCTMLEEMMLIYDILKFIGLKIELPMVMFCDNQATLDAFEPFYVTKRSKYFDIRYHKVRDQAKKGVAELLHVRSEENLSDFCTKFFTNNEFERQRDRLLKEIPILGKNGGVMKMKK